MHLFNNDICDTVFLIFLFDFFLAIAFGGRGGLVKLSLKGTVA